MKTGLAYESRLRIFTEEKELESLRKEKAWDDYVVQLRNAIGVDNSNRLSNFIKYPLSSVAITNTINQDINRVFNAGNSYFEFRTVEKYEGGLINDNINEIDVVDWVSAEGKKTLKNKANNVVVIEKDINGKAYPLIVDNNRLLSFEFEEDQISFKWICFIHSVEYDESGNKVIRYAVYDDVNYNVVVYNLNGKGNFVLESSMPHTVGYCPARMFLSEIKDSNDILSRSVPVSNVLGKLADWQTFDIEKVYAKNFVPFPVVEMERQDCGNEDCADGWIVDEKGDSCKCPDCKEANNIFIGAKILNIPQLDKDDSSSFGKYKEHSANVEGIKYLSEDNNYSEGDIIQKATGRTPKTEGQAINEVQAKGEVEAQETILFGIKQQLDSLTVWIVETIAYSASRTAKIEVFADWGTEWYLIGDKELKESFDEAKKAGLPKPEVDASYQRYISTKYKGDSSVARKLILINRIDPDPYSDFATKLLKKSNGILTGEDFYLSENIVRIINDFESENGYIVEYAKDKTIEEQTKIIKELLKQYINYEQPKEPAEPA